MREGNPFLLRPRGRQGVWGALHRSNATLAAVALCFHLGTGIGLWQLGTRGSPILFAAYTVALFFIGAAVAIGTIRSQVKLALVGQGWDELLVTPLSDRDIVNGQLVLALRPVGGLLYMTSPSLVVLVIAVAWEVAATEGVIEGLPLTTSLLVLAAMAYIALGFLLYSLTISAFVTAFLPRWGVQNMIHSLFNTALLALCGVAVFLISPTFLAALPALCWYQHRELCCTLRQRLLDAR